MGTLAQDAVLTLSQSGTTLTGAMVFFAPGTDDESLRTEARGTVNGNSVTLLLEKGGNFRHQRTFTGTVSADGRTLSGILTITTTGGLIGPATVTR